MQISGIERVILSFILSIAIVPLIALILNFTPLGVRLEPVLYATSGFIVFASIIAWLRRRPLPIEERFNFELKITPPVWNRQATIGSVVLMVIILGAIGILVYFVAHPQPADAYTEFYLLPVAGEDFRDLSTLQTGQVAEVDVEIVSHELTIADYQIDVMLNDNSYKELDEISLQPGEKSIQLVSFVFNETGQKQNVEFILYKDGLTYLQPLYLWVNVEP
jgi:uncharacterized membrane protein